MNEDTILHVIIFSKTYESMCYSFPGMLASAPRMEANGVSEQRLVIARGPTGCLDGTLHSIMRNLVVVLGKRNEAQRGDRDRFIQVYPGNITTGKWLLLCSQ